MQSLNSECFEELDAVCSAAGALVEKYPIGQIALELGKSKTFSPELRQLGLEVFIGRMSVKEYFPKLSNGYFTKQGLEQRTHPLISTYHAQFFSNDHTLLEVGTGLGFDTQALALTASKIISLEINPIHASFAKKNLSLLGITNVEIKEINFYDFLHSDEFKECNALWADPMRRTADSRTKVGEEFSPKLSDLMSVPFDRAVIKINPTDKSSFSGWRPEWIGLHKECKEKLLVKDSSSLEHFRKTVYFPESKARFESSNEVDNECYLQELPEAPFILMEPHAALLASELSDQFFTELGAMIVPKPGKLAVIKNRDDLKINQKKSEVFSIFQIDLVESFKLLLLKKILKDRNWDSRTELKKANFPEEPEKIRQSLGLQSPSSQQNTSYGVVFFTKIKERKIMCFGSRVTI